MRSAYFPFHRIGFHCNPFRALRPEEWSQVVVLPAEILAPLEQDHLHIQILGEAGHGKTAALRGIETHLTSRNYKVDYEYLGPGERRLRRRPERSMVFLLDEAQRLGWRSRRALEHAARRGTRLIWSSHQDLTDTLRKLDGELRTIRLTRPDLSAIVQRRLEYFSHEATPAISFSGPAITYLEREFEGNARAALAFLYEFFQTYPAPGVLSEADLQVFQDSLTGTAEP